MDHKKAIGIFLIILFVAISAVSAVDVTSDSNTTTVDIDSQSNDVSTSESSENIQTSTINVGVKYEYEKDNEITPTITVNDKDNNKLTSTKEYDENLGFYYVSVDHKTENPSFNVSISAPGYLSQSQIYKTNLTKSLVFNLKASESYKLGQSITATADSKLNFSSADDILVITTAGVPKYNNKTSEDVMEAILNYMGDKVSFGKGNMLMLRQTAVDPIDTCFVVKNGKELTSIVFCNASNDYSYLGTISEDMTKQEWNNFFKSVIVIP